MNKYVFLVVLLAVHFTEVFAQKHLKDNLIVRGNIPAILLADGGRELFFAQRNKVFCWSRPENRISDSIDFQTSGKVIVLDYNSKSQMMAAGFQWGELFIAGRNGKAERLQTKGGAIISLKFSNDGNFLAVGTADCNLSMWEVANRRLLWSKKEHSDHVLSISFSPNDSIVFSGSADKQIGIWNRQSGAVSGYLTESGSWVRKLALSEATSTLFAATDEGSICRWKIDGANGLFSGKKKETLSWATALAVGEDGTYVSGFKNGYFVFRTKFGNYHTNFRQPVIDVVLISENEYVSFFVSVFNQGLYFVDLGGKAFKLSSK